MILREIYKDGKNKEKQVSAPHKARLEGTCGGKGGHYDQEEIYRLPGFQHILWQQVYFFILVVICFIITC